MKNKRIAFIIPSLRSGGAERVICTLANHLIQHNNVLIIKFDSQDSVYPLDSKIEVYDCNTNSGKNIPIITSIINNIRLYNNIKKKIGFSKIDLTIAFTTTANILGTLASKRNRIPVVISERANPYVFKPNFFWKTLRRFSYPKANRVIVQSKLSEKFYKGFIKKDKIKILPNALSKELISHKKSCQRKNIVLSVGRLDDNKSQDILINAFARSSNENWNLVLVGDGVNKKKYLKLCEELNIQDKVLFSGTVSNVWDYYNEAKIFVLSSKAEGFPNSLIEAMYFEMACISTNCQIGPSEIIENNKNGLLFPVDDVDRLVYLLNKLMNKEEAITSLSKNTKTIINDYHPEKVLSMWVNMFEELTK